MLTILLLLSTYTETGSDTHTESKTHYTHYTHTGEMNTGCVMTLGVQKLLHTQQIYFSPLFLGQIILFSYLT